MRDWIAKLDEFLRVSGRELLNHAGKISAEMAKIKAETEYNRYQSLEDARPRLIDDAFETATRQLQKPSPPRGRKRKIP